MCCCFCFFIHLSSILCLCNRLNVIANEDGPRDLLSIIKGRKTEWLPLFAFLPRAVFHVIVLSLTDYSSENHKQVLAVFCFYHIFAHCGLIFFTVIKKSCTLMDSTQPRQEKEVTEQCLLCIVTKLQWSKSLKEKKKKKNEHWISQIFLFTKLKNKESVYATYFVCLQVWRT